MASAVFFVVEIANDVPYTSILTVDRSTKARIYDDRIPGLSTRFDDGRQWRQPDQTSGRSVLNLFPALTIRIPSDRSYSIAQV